MKNILVIKSALTVGLLSFVLISPTQAKADSIQRLAENLCEYAKTDNRSNMRKKLKVARLKLKEIYPGLTCGKDGSLMRVAVSNDSLNAAKFIASKAGKKGLANVEKDGKTALQFTEGLVTAGDSTKQPFVDVIQAKQ
jgi:ribosomal protein L17